MHQDKMSHKIRAKWSAFRKIFIWTFVNSVRVNSFCFQLSDISEDLWPVLTSKLTSLCLNLILSSFSYTNLVDSAHYWLFDILLEPPQPVTALFFGGGASYWSVGPSTDLFVTDLILPISSVFPKRMKMRQQMLLQLCCHIFLLWYVTIQFKTCTYFWI